jgi:hypothetical protein
MSFGEFSVPADMHDVVYFDMIERGYIPQETEADFPDFELEIL